VSTKGLKNVGKKGFSSPNHRPANTWYLFFLLKSRRKYIITVFWKGGHFQGASHGIL